MEHRRIEPCDFAVGISVRHFHRVFGIAGESVCEFLRKRRLQRCDLDLLDGRELHLSISEVAYREGFFNACYSSDAFKAEFGVFPRDVRKRGNAILQTLIVRFARQSFSVARGAPMAV